MTLHAKRNSPGRAAGAAALLMALAGGLTSCAPHYLVEPAPPGPGASMDALLVPPQVHALAADAFLVAYPGAGAGAGCDLEAGSIRLHTAHDSLTVTLPGSAAAAEPFSAALPLQPGAVIEHQRRLNLSGDALVAGLDQLVARGCLPLHGPLPPLTRVLQGVPLASQQLAEFTAGEPVADGYMDLRFGEQLRVTAPLLDAGGQWRGATTLWYGIRRERDGRLRLLPPPASAIQRVQGGRRLHAQALDLPAAPAARYLRMIILGRQDGFTVLNILLGAPDPATLKAATALVQAKPEGCAQMAAPVWCSTPKYGTVINLELSVQLQGRWRALPLGANVADALRAAGALPAPAGLRIRRPFGGRLIRVNFNPASAAILHLLLLGGEQIRWDR